MNTDISDEQINQLYAKLNDDAESSGYHLNPDIDFTKALVKSLLVNEQRYGYQACPCRLASGKKDEDIDIICPCDYRDQDLNEFNACYCGLYVSESILEGKDELTSIPERRPSQELRDSVHRDKPRLGVADVPLPVWRCKVCGYLCARDEPPDICPICKVQKDRFERFI